MTGPDRQRLPDRRDGDLVSFEHEGLKYHAQFSRDRDGRIKEMFLNAGKAGASVNVMARELAVILSVALQFGAPLAVIEDALPKLHDGAPAGPVGVALAKIKEKK